MKRILSVFTALTTLVLSLCACNATRVNTALKPFNRDVLVLGFYEDSEPFGYIDENGAYCGFDLEVAKEIARRFDVTLNLRPVSKEKAVDELKSGTIDFLGNNLFLTERELADLIETDDLFENRQVIVVKDNSTAKKKSELAGKKIGVVIGEPSQRAYLDEKHEIKADDIAFETRSEAEIALVNGEVDALITDEVWARKRIVEGKDIRIVGGEIEDYDLSLVFAKENRELAKQVEKMLESMEKDGTLNEITQKCFGMRISALD